MAYFNYQLRNYYQPALEAQEQQPTYYTNQPARPQVPVSQQLAGLGRFGAVAGGLFAAGYIPTSKGRVWNKYVSAIRTVEEYSPGGVLRTFQLSPFFSQFAKYEDFHIPAKFFMGNEQTPYYSKLLGGQRERLLREGLTYRSGRLFWGTGQDIALKYAGIYTTTPGAYSRLGSAYATSLGAPRVGQPFHKMFSSAEGVLAGGLPAQIIGGQSRLQAVGRQAAAVGTELISRFNRLLELPFELPGLSNLYRGFTRKTGFRLSVKETGGLEMLGRMVGKFGVGLPAAYLGYQMLDYWTRQASIFDKTIFAEGITTGVATAGIRANLMASKAADVFGLHDYREKQEEIAPGSTSLLRLAGFPLVGALGAATLGWGIKAGRMALGQFQGQSLHAAREATEGAFTRQIGTLFGRGVSARKALIGGAAVLGALAAAPFLPGALIPSTRPEELEDIYSGKKLVPIRKGRWWLFGRSPYEGERILAHVPHWSVRMATRARERAIWKEDETGREMSPFEKFWKREFTYHLEELHGRERPYPLCLHKDTPIWTKHNGFVPIKSVNVGDFVLNKNGEYTEVVNISNRKCHEGELLSIKIAADNRLLKLTADHKVLAIKNTLYKSKRNGKCNHKSKVINNGKLKWICAKDLQVSDIVVIPKIVQANEIQCIDLGVLCNLPHTKTKVIFDNRATQARVDIWNTSKEVKDVYKDYKVSYKEAWRIKKRGYKRISNRYINIDSDFALFFGLYLAEGWTGKKTVELAFNKNEVDTYVKFIQDYVLNTFKAKSVVKEVSENGVRLIIHSSLLKRVISSLTEDKRATNKYIPDIVFSFNERNRKSLIKGLIRGDGSYKKEREITFTSSSSALAGDLRILLLSVGIKSSISFKRACRNKPKIKNRVINGGDSYCLSITGSDYNKFADFEEEINCIDIKQDRKGYTDNNYLYIPIRSIEKEKYNDEVYDLTVKSTSSFLSTCIVHNSGVPFEDVPFIGPLLASTLGRFVKPQKYMFKEQWLSEKGTKVPPLGYGQKVATELGEVPGGMPVSAHTAAQTIGEQAYRATETVGLPGFTFGAIKQAITGREEFFDQDPRLEEASRIASYERKYWEQELGDPMGLCFVKNTKIKLINKVKNIQDVQIGDYVLTHGEYKQVIDKLEKINDKQVVNIKSLPAGVNIKCTKNHWIPVLRRHKYNDGHVKPFNNKNFSIFETQAKDIKKGDFLFYEIDKQEIPLILDLKDYAKSYTEDFVYLHANQERALCWEFVLSNPLVSRSELRTVGFDDIIAKDVLRNFKLNKLPTRIKRFLAIDTDLAYIIGWYIAEGSQDGAKIKYTMNSNEHIYATKISSIFENIGVKTHIKVKNNTLILTAYSSILARCFAMFGQNSQEKHIPFCFKTLPKQELEKMLEGLLLGDGWSNGFTSVSDVLVKDVFDCLLKLNIPSRIYLNYTEKGNGFYPQGTLRNNCKRSYLFFIKRDHSWKFIDNAFLVKVTDIEDISEDFDIVYDLTIEDLHHYTAEGVRVHNTEFYRRLFPHRRRQIELVNPIENLMPKWLPGPGARGPNFQHGDPYCITADTLVETKNDGFKTPNNITVGDRVRTHTGKWVNPLKVVKRRMRKNEKLYKIKVSSISAFPIKASEEHPFWTTKGWITADCLKIGDYVGYPLPVLEDLIEEDNNELLDLSEYCDLPFNSTHIFIQGSQEYANCVEVIENNPGPYKRGERKELLSTHNLSVNTFENAQAGIKHNRLNRIPRYINQRCKEWGLLSGYYVAEGSVNQGSLSFAFDRNEHIYHNEVLDSVKYLFNVKGNIYPNSKGNGIQVIITNKALAQIFPRIFGKDSYNKVMPVWHGSFISALGALFNGDGSFFFDKKKPRLSLKSKSVKLLWSVRQLLLPFGFVGSIVEDNLIYRGQAAKDCARFISTNKYKNCKDSSRTVRHTYIKDKYVWMRVFSKEEVEQESVYGIEVNIDDSFCVVGVATHNTKIPHGELRLPGPGYAALNPEVRGVDPAKYPLIHQYKILADTAMYTDEFKEIQGRIRGLRKTKSWSDNDESIYQQVKEQLAERKKYTTFEQYKYLSPMGEIFGNRTAADHSSAAVAVANKLANKKEDRPSLAEKTFGGYWEWLSHNAELSSEALTPMAPGAKLINQRSAIEQYEKEQVFGSKSAFWSHPYRDFIKPFTQMFSASMGAEKVPESVRIRRGIEEQFDILQWMKHSRFANMARAANDWKAVKEFERKKDETMFGVNPYSMNFTSIYRALPRRDRDYFKEFSEATTADEQKRILDLVPENERALYVARWQMMNVAKLKKARAAGVFSDEQLKEANQIIEETYKKAKTEGFPSSKELMAEYWETRQRGENYGDWYRRTKLLPNMPNVPGPDWIGWCIPKYQDVILSDGSHLPAKDVTINSQISTHKETGMVKQIYKRQVNEQINRIHISGNTVDHLDITGNHLILALQAQKCPLNRRPTSVCTTRSMLWKCHYCTDRKFDVYEAKWTPAKDINDLTFLLYPLLSSTNEDLTIDCANELDWNSENCTVSDTTIFPKSGIRNPMNRHIAINEAVAWMVGYYLAEGNIWKTGGRTRGVQFTAALSEKPILLLAQQIISKYFGLKGRIIERHRKTGKSAYLVVASGMFALLMEKWVGRYCDKKFAPYWLEQITKNSQIALLDGLCTGDASKDGRDRLVIANYHLAFMAKRIWESFGQPVSLHKKCRRNRKDIYSVSPVDYPLQAIYLDNYIAYKVSDNQLIDYQGNVFDFEVQSDHSYLTPIATLHNSPSINLEDVKLKLIKDIGADPFEYNIWQQQQARLPYKPFITSQVAKEAVSGEVMPREEIRSRINTLLTTSKIANNTFVTPSHNNEINITVRQEPDMKQMKKDIEDIS